MNNRTRAAAIGLVFSAASLVGLVSHEAYRPTAYLPTPVDRPTIGFGETYNPDGTPVRLGQKTTPVRALKQLNDSVDKTQAALYACIGSVPLYQYEWDAYVSLAYNIGSTAFCKSTISRLLNQSPPDYAGACQQILRWNRQAGRVLPGLVKRRQDEYRQCVGSDD